MTFPALCPPGTLLVLPSLRLQLISAELWDDEVVLHLALEPSNEDGGPSFFDADYWGRELALEIYAGNTQLIEMTRSVGKVGRRYRIDSYHSESTVQAIAEAPRLIARLGKSDTEVTLTPLTPGTAF